MKCARFFVTVVVLMTAVASSGCGGKKSKGQLNDAQVLALREEGKGKWDQSEVLSKELAQSLQIIILDEPHDSRLMGQKYNWHRLTLAERQAAKEKLAQFVTLTSRLIEIDARKGMYLTHMSKVRSRYDGALSFQQSLSRFEAVVGEQYEPKNPGLPPIYFAPVNI